MKLTAISDFEEKGKTDDPERNESEYGDHHGAIQEATPVEAIVDISPQSRDPQYVIDAINGAGGL